MDGDRLVGAVALAEVIAFEHASNGVLRRQANEVRRAQLVHPGGVEGHLGPGRIEDLEHLSLVGLGIIQDLLTGQRRASGALATGVADHSGEVADQEDHLVPELLELAQLINKHGMSQVQVRRGRIETCLDA
ncbi:hypothetical protein D9M71_354560 [compost metagenome]